MMGGTVLDEIGTRATKMGHITPGKMGNTAACMMNLVKATRVLDKTTTTTETEVVVDHNHHQDIVAREVDPTVLPEMLVTPTTP